MSEERRPGPNTPHLPSSRSPGAHRHPWSWVLGAGGAAFFPQPPGRGICGSCRRRGGGWGLSCRTPSLGSSSSKFWGSFGVQKGEQELWGWPCPVCVPRMGGPEAAIPPSATGAGLQAPRSDKDVSPRLRRLAAMLLTGLTLRSGAGLAAPSHCCSLRSPQIPSLRLTPPLAAPRTAGAARRFSWVLGLTSPAELERWVRGVGVQLRPALSAVSATGRVGLRQWSGRRAGRAASGDVEGCQDAERRGLLQPVTSLNSRLRGGGISRGHSSAPRPMTPWPRCPALY